MPLELVVATLLLSPYIPSLDTYSVELNDPQLVKISNNKRNENKGKIEDIMRDVPPMVGPLSPLCSFCGTSGKLQKCSRCKINLYCSRTCQSIQWEEHKKYCLKV